MRKETVTEVSMVFDLEGHAIFWPSPKDNQASYIPDSRTLWDRIWDSRCIIGGIAHTHPWDGPSGPSTTDVTTFAAIEAGLGRPLLWPIVTMTHVSYYCQNRITKEYVNAGPVSFKDADWWEDNITELRAQSQRIGEIRG